MSFYRTLLVLVAALALALPAYADDTAAANPASNAAQPAIQANASAAEQTKINLNNATVKELIKVKGITAPKARSIIAYRKKHGSFKSTDDLKQVKGFKKMKGDSLKEISDQLTIE